MPQDNWLAHYGIPGQRWGVRRFQDKDGRLTEEGKRRYRAFRTMSDVEEIFSTFSEKDKQLFGGDGRDDRYLTPDEHAYWIAKRFLVKEGKTPVAFLDIIGRSNQEADITIGTHADYRGKGYAQKVAKRGSNWIDKNSDVFTKVNWGAFKENKASIKLAEANGFKLDEEFDDYVLYAKKGKG